MPSGWKKRVGKSDMSRHERCGGSRHHRSMHGNASRRSCSLCSYGGIDKSLSKQKGCKKQNNMIMSQYMDDDFSDVFDDDYYESQAQITSSGQCLDFPKNSINLYDKSLSDYFVSTERFRQTSKKSSTVINNNLFESLEDEKCEESSSIMDNSEDTSLQDDDNDWEVVSIESVISI